jgi:uncharacterized membrane protein
MAGKKNRGDWDLATAAPGKRAHPFAPDTFERVLAIGALILLAAATTAILKGHASWHQVPAVIWLHLATIFVALALTPVMLLRPRGDRLHRRLGWMWTSAMLLTAIDSLFIHVTNPGGFSIIHILSAWTIIQVPIIVWSARQHNVKRHRSSVRGMVLGALLIAGFFTFPFNRLLGQWLFG